MEILFLSWSVGILFSEMFPTSDLFQLNLTLPKRSLDLSLQSTLG